MTDTSSDEALVRPERVTPTPVDPIPQVDESNADKASVAYSHYRTGLSRHRTGLSEHRTDLSEFRTSLSQHRTEMSMRRTGMSIQRTRLSADRTLMSVIRTALSLIGFGFTIYQAFQKLHEAGVLHRAQAPRNFGLTLIVLGTLLLLGGILNHIRFAMELRHTRSAMTVASLIHGQSRYPVSITFLTAIALMLVGVAAVATIVFDVPIFG
jgi:uncharacterized membrane protein YidH (DUF202 family)